MKHYSLNGLGPAQSPGVRLMLERRKAKINRRRQRQDKQRFHNALDAQERGREFDDDSRMQR